MSISPDWIGWANTDYTEQELRTEPTDESTKRKEQKVEPFFRRQTVGYPLIFNHFQVFFARYPQRSGTHHG
jgi:hypothetical protein